MGDPERTEVQPAIRLRMLHIAALSCFAVAQPLFAVLARDTTFFVAHDSSVWDLVLFVFTVVLAVPLALVLLQLIVARISPAAGGSVHLVEIALLFAVILLPALKNLLPSTPWFVVITAVGIGGLGFGLLCSRSQLIRSWLTLISPVVVVFPVWFLFFTPVRTIIAPPPVAVDHQGADSTVPVILVVFDELPVSSLMNAAGQINATRFPGFARLAERSWWFRNASSVAQSTSYALPAILTGRYPTSARSPMLSQYPENLFTYLGSGYEQRVVEILTRLCPPEFNSAKSAPAPLLTRVSSLIEDTFFVYLHIILPADLSVDLPAISATWRDFGGENDSESDDPRSRTADSGWVFDYFLDQIGGSKDPTLHFLHVNLPHLPWKYLPSGLEYGPVGASIYPHGMCGEYWCGDEWEIIQGWQRHLLQLVFADRLLDRLIDRVEKQDLWDRSLIIVTSDHGVSFRSGEGRREITPTNARDILAVPLFVKTPGQRTAEISDRNVETIDILPTITDVLGFPLAWPVDGWSVFLPTERPEKVIFRTVGSEPPERHVFPGAGPNVQDTVERMISHFGVGSQLEGLFRIGPFSSLIGLEPSGLIAGDLPPIEVRVQQTGSFDQVDPASGYLPAHIVGVLRVPKTTRERLPLAVAINGTIRATTDTYGHRDGVAHFSALTPEEAWTPGHNLVEIFIVRGTPKSVQLQPTRMVTTTSYRLKLTPTGQIEGIFDTNDRHIRLVTNAIQGEIDFGKLTAHGWAADLESGEPAESVLVFQDTNFLFSTSVRQPRPGIAKREGHEGLRYCGFRFTMPSAMILNQRGQGPRFFAVRGDRASEIFPIQ